MIVLFRDPEEKKELERIINREYVRKGVCIKGTNKRIRVKIGATDIDELRLPKKSITQDNIIQDGENITVIIKNKKRQFRYTSKNYEIVDKNNIIIYNRYGRLKLRKNTKLKVGPIFGMSPKDEDIYGLCNVVKKGKTITCYDLMGNLTYEGSDYICRKFSILAFLRCKKLEYQDHKQFKYKAKFRKYLVEGVPIQGTNKIVRAKNIQEIRLSPYSYIWIPFKPISPYNIIQNNDGSIILLSRERNYSYATYSHNYEIVDRTEKRKYSYKNFYNGERNDK
jgi:hypothetical protein